MKKKISCRMLGGACAAVFEAATFTEAAKQSQEHAKTMAAKNDAAHIQAMQRMQQLMETPGAFDLWYAEKKAVFDAL